MRDPDALLEKIKKEKRGKLTVFLGAAAGVGKTYTMLEAAQDLLKEDVDILIGWVETHRRAETEELTAGLPRLAPKIIEYRGKALAEMDVDAIIARHPSLVLVDELAHTNVPGARHVRRFQDVDEILNAGIDVYTTLNIQHIESLNDIVAQITGIIVRETVPDAMLERADYLQLIDITPEELIKRLKEGKVYVPGQVQTALKKFFRPGNISALRELALRFTAGRVDTQLNEYMKEHNIDGPWPAAERVMVCVSASPFSAQLIRAARRMSKGLQADFIAVHIETVQRRFPMGDVERDRLVRNMSLAEELGAKTLNILGRGKSLTDDIMEVARQQNVTALVLGKPRHSKLRDWVKGSVVDKVIRDSGKINVYVVRGGAEKDHESAIKASAPKTQVVPRHYIGVLVMNLFITSFGFLFKSQLELLNISLLYLLPVLLSAFWWGRWPSYFSALFSVLAIDWLFIPPIHNFDIADIRYLWSFITFLIVAFVIGKRTELLKHEAVVAISHEKSTQELYEYSREIAAVVDMDKVVEVFLNKAGQTLDMSMIIMMPNENNRLLLWAEYDKVEQETVIKKQDIPDNAEKAVAVWAYEHGQTAGRSTTTLPGAKYLYVILRTQEKVVGIWGIDIIKKTVTPEQRRLIEAWAGLSAIAMERVQLAAEAHKASLLEESHRLHSALFNSISHELRTPLSLIIGSVSTLLEADTLYDCHARHELLENVKVGADRMDRLIANLLDTARLEAGMMKLKEDWCDIEDIVGVALRQISDRMKERQLEINIPDGLPLIRGDFVLLQQVVVNLVDNAMKYSPPKSPIVICAVCQDKWLKISISDRGIGIKQEELVRIFDKFYRIKHPQQVSGTGLGLSICKAIVEAHGGTIYAKNRMDGGAVFTFTLPVKEINTLVEQGEVHE